MITPNGPESTVAIFYHKAGQQFTPVNITVVTRASYDVRNARFQNNMHFGIK